MQAIIVHSLAVEHNHSADNGGHAAHDMIIPTARNHGHASLPPGGGA
nr:Hypothetical protein [Raoultella ornithinolytica]UGK55418.1 Hypothetical protein [Raoultella ornithinolytica]UGK55460.1 Hypothetical protein [Raoultella ornithinolytica]